MDDAGAVFLLCVRAHCGLEICEGRSVYRLRLPAVKHDLEAGRERKQIKRRAKPQQKSEFR